MALIRLVAPYVAVLAALVFAGRYLGSGAVFLLVIALMFLVPQMSERGGSAQEARHGRSGWDTHDPGPGEL